ncbi:MAG TPA: Hsp20/alpha crystallin family protein [Candidatus Binatia bacterium]|nr:Hsp20/alpha crystallin family protein [Candidatus Binatia bacterium]
MALIRFSPELDPVDALLSLQRELGRVFESPSGFDLGLSGRGVYPPLNVFSDRDGSVLRMEVPGIAPENLAIEAQGRTLTVSGKREIKTPEKGSFHRRERSGGEFSRSLQLPSDLDLSRAEASCQHGILTIRVPKKEEAKPRQITIHAV